MENITIDAAFSFIILRPVFKTMAARGKRIFLKSVIWLRLEQYDNNNKNSIL